MNLPTAELVERFEHFDVSIAIQSLSTLALERNEQVTGFAPILHLSQLDPNPALDSITSESALQALQSLFVDADIKPYVLDFLQRCLDVFDTQPTLADGFLFITNSLQNEINLWELAFTDTDESVNAQQTILNYIEANTDYPFSGGVEPTSEEDLGLRPPKPILVPVPSRPRTDKKIYKLPERRTLHKVDTPPQNFAVVADGKQKVYSLISIFVSASALYLLQKSYDSKK